MKIFFRADGNETIGAGHIMRCLAIADEAARQGCNCRFIVADESFVTEIQNHGHNVSILYSDYTHMDEEMRLFRGLIAEEIPDMIFVDSYYVTEHYLSAITKLSRTAYIDDVKAFPYPVNLLINYNANAFKLDYEKFYQENGVTCPKLLLGWKYAPLRSEFQHVKPIEIREQIRNVMFSAGGLDPERVALEFVKAVQSSCANTEMLFHLVLGKYEPDVDEIKSITLDDKRFAIHQNVQKMAELMTKCDVAISAAGSTLYELCAYGVPTISYVLAENQLLGMESLVENGLVVCAGDWRIEQDILYKILCFLNDEMDYEMREKLQKKMLLEISPGGTKNLVDLMCCL